VQRYKRLANSIKKYFSYNSSEISHLEQQHDLTAFHFVNSFEKNAIHPLLVPTAKVLKLLLSGDGRDIIA
jgi:hypothetical protein